VSKFLVDSNLPQTYNLWQGTDFIYAVSIKIDGDDNLIWNYARENNLTILSRDKDFADRIIHTNPPPKVIHFRLGNIRFRDLRKLLNSEWERIIFFSHNYKLVLVYPNSIEGIK